MAGKLLIYPRLQSRSSHSQFSTFFGKQLPLELNWVIVNCLIMWLKQQIKDIAFLATFVIFQNRRSLELGTDQHCNLRKKYKGFGKEIWQCKPRENNTFLSSKLNIMERYQENIFLYLSSLGNFLRDVTFFLQKSSVFFSLGAN